MKPKNSGSGRRIVCLVLVAVMLLGLISSALIIMVNAASSSEIKKELNGLRSQQAELKKEREALQAKIKENQSKTQTLVEKKSDIDQQISMTQVPSTTSTSRSSSTVCSSPTSRPTSSSQAEEQRLNTQYKTRIRSMERRAASPTGPSSSMPAAFPTVPGSPAHPPMHGYKCSCKPDHFRYRVSMFPVKYKRNYKYSFETEQPPSLLAFRHPLSAA
mgnify:CR=1 FL=1